MVKKRKRSQYYYYTKKSIPKKILIYIGVTKIDENNSLNPLLHMCGNSASPCKNSVKTMHVIDDGWLSLVDNFQQTIVENSRKVSKNIKTKCRV